MNMLLARYREVKTHYDSDRGPGNLSGIQHDLQAYIDNAEAEATRAFGTPQLSPRLTELNKRLRVAIDNAKQSYDGPAPFTPTEYINHDPEVERVVALMHDMAFATDYLDPVASHPLFAVVINYVAFNLTGYFQRDPDYFVRVSEASDKLDTRIAELEEEERRAEEAMAEAEAIAEHKNEMALAFPGDRFGPDPEDERERYLENLYMDEMAAAYPPDGDADES